MESEFLFDSRETSDPPHIRPTASKWVSRHRRCVSSNWRPAHRVWSASAGEVCDKNAMRSSTLLLVTFALGPLVGSARQAPVAPTEIAKDVRKHLLSLPYYGVFDLLTFNVDNNDVVTLAGYVLTGSLKNDTEREAREVKGVSATTRFTSSSTTAP